MSDENEILKNIELESTWEPDIEFYKKALELLVDEVTGNSGYYYRRSEASLDVLNDDTFSYLWSEHPSKREMLLSDIIDNNGYRTEPYTKEYRKETLESVYSAIPVDGENETNRMRMRLIPNIYPMYDYLAELNKFGLTEDTENLHSMWSNVGMNHSCDSNFFDYLWAKVKRAPGSVKRRIQIVEAAFENDAISKKMLLHVAKRGTKNLKRSMTSSYSQKMSDLRRQHWRLERQGSDLTGAKKRANVSQIQNNQKKIDEVEGRLMLFVDCDDERVVGNLIDSLSKDNLPWLMPAASKHYWLSRRLQKKIEEGN